MAAHAARRSLAAVHHRGELRLLRRLGLAVLLPPRLLHRLEPGLRRRDPRAGRHTDAEVAPRRGARGEPRRARLLQVLRLLRHVDEQPVRARGHRPPARGALDPPAGRDLVLHVHGDQLRRGRLPRRLRPRRLRHVRRVPVVLPAPRRRPDRAARRADPAALVAARPAIRGHLARVLPHRDRALHEGRDRQPPRREHRGRGLRRAEPAFVARGARRASTRTPSRSTRTSSGTRTSRSASRSCSASPSRRTSTRPTRRPRSRTSGAAGT